MGSIQTQRRDPNNQVYPRRVSENLVYHFQLRRSYLGRRYSDRLRRSAGINSDSDATLKRRAARKFERNLLIEYHNTRSEAVRERVILRFAPMARRLARRYSRSREPFEDLYQVALLGLVKAIERYDPHRETAFSSFAVPTILGELKRYFRDYGWNIHVSRGMQEQVLRVARTEKELTRQLRRSPTEQEIAQRLHVTPEQVVNAMQAAQAYDTLSLDAHRVGKAGDGLSYADTMGRIDRNFELLELSLSIRPAWYALPKRDRLILWLRYVEDLTQAEIARKVGISQMHVSRLIQRALDRLQTVSDQRV